MSNSQTNQYDGSRAESKPMNVCQISEQTLPTVLPGLKDKSLEPGKKSRSEPDTVIGGILKLPTHLAKNIPCKSLNSLTLDYRIHEQIGYGTFATVWRVTRHTDQAVFAAKIVS